MCYQKAIVVVHKIMSVVTSVSEVNAATILLKGEKQDFILNEKKFQTGSRGYHAQGKMQVKDKRYQINILCVEIGSKPKEK